MNQENDISLGPCLRRALKDIDKHPDRKLMMGPPAFPDDSAHFWTKDENQIYEPLKKTPKAYKYAGREVNPESIKEELGI